jgi:hypothetical protein
MTHPNQPSEDRWMYVAATLVFCAMIAGGLWWLISINFFYFKATFPVGEFGSFLICALVIVINIAMRIPALLRWVLRRPRT